MIGVCRDKEGEHKLISKTDAKKEFILSDVDLERREPKLQFILRKNPHRMGGEMKLYLYSQMKERALEVWETEEGLEEAREQRKSNKRKRQQNAFEKKMKDMRKQARGSKTPASLLAHNHDYGEEEHDPDEDTYSKSCQTCGHQITYEKM
ncbi:XPA [Cordylochernes scorpioides]|uniref:XPA n=1 Tax=Cordylochernes scorpioides TaxID=51811 RepID=A0ABY6KAN9_9ARAC|nr:XPA [Cordylochernes scorpioides]